MHATALLRRSERSNSILKSSSIFLISYELSCVGPSPLSELASTQQFLGARKHWCSHEHAPG